MLPDLPVSASDNTQYGATQASLLLGGAAALDLHKGLAPSVLPPQEIFLHHFREWLGQNSCGFANSLPEIFAKEKPVPDMLSLKVFR